MEDTPLKRDYQEDGTQNENGKIINKRDKLDNNWINNQDKNYTKDNCDSIPEIRKASHRKERLHKLFKAVTLLGCTFTVHFLCTGLSFSIGVYYVEFLDVFNRSSGLTSWIGSLNFAALCGAGPIASYLIQKVGCAKTIIIGGLVSTIGIFTSVFAHNLYMIFASFGVMTGIGYGFGFTACLSVINLEFDQWRVFGMGVSLCGVGLGTFIQPFLANYLLAMYGWRGALLITASITMHVCLAGLIISLVTDAKSVNIQNNSSAKAKTTTVNQDKTEQHKNSEIAIFISEDPQAEKSIWVIPKYWALHANSLLFCFGQSVVYTHIASYATNCGFNSTLCSSFISIVGITNLVGRIGLGLIAQHPSISDHVNTLFILCYMTAGLWTVFYCLWNIYVIMAINMALLGMSMAAFGPLLSEVVCRTVGVHKFAEGYGFLMVSMAMGTLLGAPSAGWLYDITMKYNNSFYLGGTAFVLSALIMIFPNIYDHVQRKRNRFLSQNMIGSSLHLQLESRSFHHSLRNIPLYSSQPLIPQTVLASACV